VVQPGAAVEGLDAAVPRKDLLKRLRLRKKGSADRSSQTREPASWGAITAKKGLKSKIESGLPPDCGMVDEQTAAPARSLSGDDVRPGAVRSNRDDCHHPKRRMSVGFPAPTMHTYHISQYSDFRGRNRNRTADESGARKQLNHAGAVAATCSCWDGSLRYMAWSDYVGSCRRETTLSIQI
jgi:hypothetical protein